MTKKQKIIYYTILVFISIVFFLSGIAKILDKSVASAEFTMAGLPLWFMHVIGIGEIVGAVALWIKSLFRYAYEGLFIIMIGAFGVTWELTGIISTIYPLVFIILLSIIVWLQKKSSLDNFEKY